MYVHPDDFVRIQQELKAKEVQEPSPAGADVTQVELPAVTSTIRDKLHLAHSRWIVKHKRPLSITEDEAYRHIWKLAMHGAYVPPDHHTVLSGVLKLSSQGLEKLRKVNSSMRKAGLKPSIAGDIWSDRGVSLFGICQYHIDDGWNIIELVTAASPFSKERHTHDAIDEKTKDACALAGFPADVLSGVFCAVSDNGANMVKGWDGFGRAPCCVHKVQLSVKLFLSHGDIAPLRVKQKGIVSHFSFSTGIDGLGALKSCQKKCQLPSHHPIRDNETRWNGSHAQMEFFRVHQRAIQLYDVEHARKAGDVYKQHQLNLEDWLINCHAVAVLQPFADWTTMMQATKGYPTLPLVLPTLYHLIENTSPGTSLLFSFPGSREYELLPHEMHQGVLAARTALHEDLLDRWVTKLDCNVKRTFAIASLLHPFFKDYAFIEGLSFIPAGEKAWALKELRTDWEYVWSQHKEIKETEEDVVMVDLEADVTATRVNAASDASASISPPPSVAHQETDAHEAAPKKRKLSVGGLLRKRPATTDEQQTAAYERSELDEYLSEPTETDSELNVLQWWRGNAARWPKLARMVLQYFAAPASSAGVERLFSAAGRMHDDLKKSAKDSTLQHSLMAAYNVD